MGARLTDEELRCREGRTYDPHEFKDGDKVLVRDTKAGVWRRAYYKRFDAEGPYPYFTYPKGQDKWTADGPDEYWMCCKKWEGNE